MSDSRNVDDHGLDEEAAGGTAMRRGVGFGIIVLSVAMCLFHFATAGFGILEPLMQRAIHLTFALVLAFLLFPPPGRKGGAVNLVDIVLAAVSVLPLAHFHFDYARIVDRIEYIDPITGQDYAIAILLMLLVAEATRRVVGMGMLWVVLVVVAYTFAGPYIPGPLGHTGLSFENFIDNEVMTMSGIFSIPLAVSSTYVVIFVMFGAFLVRTGMGQTMIDMAKALAGHTRGGPAKVAVISSGLFGSINGSSIANVVATGAFTIPLMKSIGYRPHFAAAVESAASVAGQFTPPVMGAAAFIMVEVTGIGYLTIIKAAAIPAALYYAALLFAVHLEAARTDLGVLPRVTRDELKQVLWRLIPFMVPVVVLLGVLVAGYSPIKAGFYATCALVAVAMLREETRLDLNGFIDAFRIAARNAVVIAVTCAAAGIVIGVVYALGIGIKFASTIVTLSDGSLALALPLVMAASLLLGMGLPTSAAYVIVAAVAAPSLVDLGVSPLATHLFVLFFGCISSMTPPVAVASYAAAGVAGAEPMRTGLTGVRLGIAGFIVPYLFVLWPALVLEGTWYQSLIAVVPAFIGIFGLAVAVIGWLYVPIGLVMRIVFFVSSGLLMLPGFATDIPGALVLSGAVWLLRRKSRATPTGEGAATPPA